MAKETSRENQLTQAIVESLSHLRDVSLRDGVQCWDANKWKIADIVSVAEKINDFAKAVNDAGEPYGKKMSPMEVWGGGQFAQPAMFNSEDPFRNLEDIKKALPDVDMQILMRGRQCLGFKPVSAEIQEAAFKESAKRGVKVFRVFDMMNDVENLQDSFVAFKKAREEFPDIKLEGAVSYISEPEIAGKGRAFTIDNYAEYALKMAKMGADAIAIKNYSGVGDKEMPTLITAIKDKLSNNGYADMKVNLHDHGHKPDVLMSALAAGSDKVDVAIGGLSGGPSHTNMRTMLHKMLDGKFTAQEIDTNPLMQKLADVEAQIDGVVKRKDIKIAGSDELKSFDDLRAPLKKITQEDMDKYRMAGGALSDLLGKARGLAHGYNSKNVGKGKTITEQEVFERILNGISELWEKGGRFNMVTPGAKIMTDQVVAITQKQLDGKTPSMSDYTREFKDIVVGRYGVNQGMKKAIGDENFRDAILIYNAMEKFNEAADRGEVNKHTFNALLKGAGFANSEAGEPEAINFRSNATSFDRVSTTKYTISETGKPVLVTGDTKATAGEIKAVIGRAKFNLTDPNLEKILTTEPRDGSTIIDRFSFAVESVNVGLPEGLRKQMLAELTPGRSPTPTTTLADGKDNVDKLVKQDQRFDPQYLQAKNCRISKRPIVELLSLLLNDENKAEGKESTFFSMLKNIAAGINTQMPLMSTGGRLR